MMFSSKALTSSQATASTHRTGSRACTDRMITPSERYRRTHGQDVQEAWAKTWISTSISSVIADTVQNAGVRHGDGVRSCPTPMRAARRSACLALGQRRQENLHSWLLTRALTTTDTGTHGTTEPAPDSAENCCCHAKLLFRGEVSLRAMRTGYLRLRMGSILSERAATWAVRWEPCGLRCSALCMRVPSVGKLASWSRWSR
jgi:hypothetical protein